MYIEFEYFVIAFYEICFKCKTNTEIELINYILFQYTYVCIYVLDLICFRHYIKITTKHITHQQTKI